MSRKNVKSLDKATPVCYDYAVNVEGNKYGRKILEERRRSVQGVVDPCRKLSRSSA